MPNKKSTNINFIIIIRNIIKDTEIKNNELIRKYNVILIEFSKQQNIIIINRQILMVFRIRTKLNQKIIQIQK